MAATTAAVSTAAATTFPEGEGEEGLQFMVGRCGVVPGCVQEKQRIGRSSDDCRGVDCGSDDYLPSWLDARAPSGRGTLRRAILLRVTHEWADMPAHRPVWTTGCHAEERGTEHHKYNKDLPFV